MKKKLSFLKLLFALLLSFGLSNISHSQDRNTCFCNSLNIKFSGLQNNGNSCYIDVSYNWLWSTGGNPNQYPQGIEAWTSSPAQVTSMTPLSGFNTWSGYNYISPYCASTNSAAWYSNTPIPSPSTLNFRVFVNGGAATGYWLKINVLGGWPVSNCDKYICSDSVFIRRPAASYTIVPVIKPCKGEDAILSLSPVPPPGSVVEWYRTPMTGYNTCPSSIPPASPWVLAQTGGTTFPTNEMNSSECFIAIVKTACYSDMTPAYQVQVCPNESAIGQIGILSTSLGYTAPVIIDGEYNVCQKWKGVLSASWTGDICDHSFAWSLSADAGSTWTPLHTPGSGLKDQPVGELNIPAGATCNQKYIARCIISYTCGGQVHNVERRFNLIINNLSSAGSITASPFDMCGNPGCPSCQASPQAPVLCYNRATVLTVKNYCGKIVKWESSLNGSTWTPLPGAGTSAVYWTNKLTQNTQYRVTIQNGACAAASTTILVKVKPKLSGTITGSNMICPSQPCILTASSNYTGTPYCATYQWYRNGVFMSGETAATLTVTDPGSYYAIVSDKTCGISAKTNVIKVCKPVLLITGPCGLCNGQSGTLKAVFKTPPVCQPAGCTYTWRRNGVIIPGATTSSLNVTYSSVPATYEVTVNCTNCGPFKATHSIQQCP